MSQSKRAAVMVIIDNRSYQVAAAVATELARLREVERQAKLEAARKAGADRPPSKFVPWTAEEEVRLAAGFDSGRTCAELAQAHRRSQAAVEARLLKIGKISVEQISAGREKS